MMTMGQALDQAIKEHETNYPGSKVYHAEIKEVILYPLTAPTQAYRAELRASHFSVPLVHHVPIA